MLYCDVYATHSSQDADLMSEPLRSSCKRRSGWSSRTASDETVERERPSRGMLEKKVGDESASNEAFQCLILRMNPTKGLRSISDVTQSRTESQAVHIEEAVYYNL
jgi:hypothetical protein